MGVLDWLTGKPKPAPPTRTEAWLAEQIAAHRGNVSALTSAAATLAGGGGMIFGMILPGDLNAEPLLELCYADIRANLARLPDAECDRVFGLVERVNLPIDITARRAALVQSRADEATRKEAFIRGKIAELVDAQNATGLVDVAAQLSRGGMVFGMVASLPPDVREALLDACLAPLRTLVPDLSDDDNQQVLAVSRGARLPLDIPDRSDEIAARRRAIRDAAIAAAGDGEPRNPELEAAIAAAPDDDHPLLVLADWLTERAHPRGELIALQLAAADDPVAAATAADELITTHADALLGPLAAHRLTHDDRELAAFTWKRGYIHGARLSVSDYHRDGSALSVVQQLEALLSIPSGRYLAELAIGMNGEPDDSLADVIELLAHHAPSTLRALHLGDFVVHGTQSDISAYLVGELAPMWPRLRGLRRLIVQGAEIGLGKVDLPAVEHVEVRTGGLPGTTAREIAAARWPAITHLDIWCGDVDYGADATAADLAPMFARDDLPALAHLGLMNCAFVDELCPMLARSPLAAQLVELDLSLGTLSDPGAEALLAARDAFPRLARLNLTHSYVGDPVRARLAAWLAVTGDRRQVVDTHGARYVSVGE